MSYANTLESFTATLQREFASAGFIGCPLTTVQIVTLFIRGFGIDESYRIGADVACGFAFSGRVISTKQEN